MSRERALLLRGGRVVDPGNGVDGLLDLRIAGGAVTEVGADLATGGAEVLDVTGGVVGPGFIDVHSHTHSVAGHRLQALDGVTTALDLEAGLMPVSHAYERAVDEGRPLNFGFSASWAGARAAVLLGAEPRPTLQFSLELLGQPGWQRSSSPAELRRWLGLLEQELGDGALGIGVLQGYAPDSDPAEYLAVASLGARVGAPVFTHTRDVREHRPDVVVDGSDELALAAAETGAAMHHCHVHSTSGVHVRRVLEMVGRSQELGSRITTELYPYGSGSTAIGAAFLSPERLEARGLGPSSVVVLGSGERVTDADRLLELRANEPDALCLLEFLDDSAEHRDLLLRAMAYPNAIVASDAMPLTWTDGTRESLEWPLPPGGVSHPRTAGTFARALRMMVREAGAWSWSEAFRRCSWLPARLLDEVAPAARAKGHLAVGADADVVVLDPERVTDRSTYADPLRPSAGVQHLLVGGTPVVRSGEVVTAAFPGRPLRG